MASAGAIPLEEARGLTVLAWRATEDGLFLQFRGRPGELRLQSACGRCHWIVHEQTDRMGSQIVVTCHACNERVVFPLEAHLA